MQKTFAQNFDAVLPVCKSFVQDFDAVLPLCKTTFAQDFDAVLPLYKTNFAQDFDSLVAFGEMDSKISHFAANFNYLFIGN